MGKGANGETIMREIVTPRNPNTERQIYQRAIMATAMLTYSAGKELFDHSFQGYAVGSQCQQRFLKLNAMRLRSMMAADLLKTQPDTMEGRFVPRGATSCVPCPVQISEGNYPQALFVLSRDDDGNPQYLLPAPTAGETVAAYALRNGLVAGDIYTFPVMVPEVDGAYQYIVPDNVDGGYGIAYTTHFAFIRLIVKADLTSTDALTTLGQLFDIEKSPEVGVTVATTPVTTPINISLLQVVKDSNGLYHNVGAIGCIRSRRDQDLRSNSFMILSQVSNDVPEGTGLTANFVLDAWRQGEQVGNSELILEGGNF